MSEEQVRSHISQGEEELLHVNKAFLGTGDKFLYSFLQCKEFKWIFLMELLSLL